MMQVAKGQERTREFCYKLLSMCYQLPTAEWQENNLVAGLVEALEASDSNALDAALELRKSFAQTKDIEELQVEYARLFVGPYELAVPPYGSIYLEGKRKVMGESTMATLNFYRQVGIEISDEVKEVPDHIKVELELMYYLCFKEHLAVRKQDFSTAYQYAGWQQQFMKLFLSKWVYIFTDELEKNAKSDFYKYLAKVTALVIKEDEERLQADIQSQ